ncbi:MAG: LPS assembly protein LptD [Candidatus Omnitrophica bacterium]|nr:LPS assembly protein LptD [Candidatus Omnitrophota bacterium]
MKKIEYPRNARVVFGIMALAIVAVFFGALAAFAQSSDPAQKAGATEATATLPETQKKEPVELTGDSLEYKADEGKVVANGNVYLRQDNAVLYCDRLEFFRERKEAHASGNIILESDKGTVLADTAFYNFETKHGEFTNARIISYPMFGKATSITKVRDNYYVLSDGWLSTSDYDNPEYRVKSSKIDFYPGTKAVASHSTMYLGGVPVMYLPWYTQDLRENRPHFSVIPGYKKDFGAFLLMTYRVNPTEHLETTYHLDLYEHKGAGWGIDVKYEPPAFGQSLLKTYNIAEHNPGGNRIWTHSNSPTLVDRRYRVEWRHLWTIDPQTSFIAQYYKLSDADFLKKYFEKEYRADQTPPTYAIFTHSFPKSTLTVRADARVNRFESTVERLPEANLSFANQPVADTGFYVKSSSTISNLTQQAAAPTDDQHHTVRFDTDNELSRPFKVAFLEFRPYVGTEQTYYSRTLYKQDYDSIRGLFRTGSDVSTKFYRVYDVHYKNYGVEIDRLRHVVTPTVGYLFQQYPTLMSDDLYGFDSVDSRSKIDKFSLGIDNALQTKHEGKSVDLFRSLLTSEYRLHDDPSGGDRFGDHKIENEFYPNSYVTLHQDATYNREEHHIQTANYDLYLKDNIRWEFDIGQRYTYNDDSLLTTQLTYKFNPKWRTVIYDRWDIDSGVWREQQYSLVRDLHSWEVEISYNDKKGYQDSGNTVWLIFRLKAFPSVTFDGGSSYNKKKVGPGGAYN